MPNQAESLDSLIGLEFSHYRIASITNYRGRSAAWSNHIHGLRALLYVVGIHVKVSTVSRARSPAILENEVARSLCRTGAGRGNFCGDVRVIDVTDNMNIVAAGIRPLVPW